MASNEKPRIELGAALREYAESAAPALPLLRSAAAESARRSAKARFRARGLAAAAALALALSSAYLGLRPARRSGPELAAQDLESVAAFAVSILDGAALRGEEEAVYPEARWLGLSEEVDSYIVALWER